MLPQTSKLTALYHSGDDGLRKCVGLKKKAGFFNISILCEKISFKVGFIIENFLTAVTSWDIAREFSCNLCQFKFGNPMTVQPNVSLRDDYSQQKPRYLCNTQQINDKRCEICDRG